MPNEGAPQILSEGVSNRVYRRRFGAQFSLLLEGVPEITAEQAKFKPTIFDLQGLNLEDIRPNTSEEEKNFLSWIGKILKINPVLITEDQSTLESKEFYTRLNYAFSKAKDFLRQTLRYSEKQSTRVEVDRLDSRAKVFNLLRRTKIADKKTGLDQSIIYCRLVKTTIAMYNLLIAGISDIEKTKQEVEDCIMSSPFHIPDGEIRPLTEEHDEGYYGKTFCLTSNMEIKGSMESRLKTIGKAMLRGFNRPESSVRAALEDATAFRLTVNNREDALATLLNIYNFLKERGKALNLENKNILSPAQIKEAQKQGITITTTKKKRFEALILKGGFGSDEPNKQFEIQIVLIDNRNEEGKMHHDIYDINKKVMACTRLSGWCSSAQLQQFIEEALHNSTLTLAEIKKELFERLDAPIVKVKRRGENAFYVSREVYERWNGFQWVDREVIDSLKI